MGQASSLQLTQYDMEELLAYCNGAWTQYEVEGLYRRFRSLDRAHKGYISGEEFLAIPELSINPIASRLVRMYESVNFKEFVKLLAPFSAKATEDDKLEMMFQVYDVDGDGMVSPDDMRVMLRQLAGSTLNEDDLSFLISKALEDTGCTAGLKLPEFKRALKDADISAMLVEVPEEM